MKYVEFFAIIIEYINYIVITIIIIARTLAWLFCLVFVLFVCLFVCFFSLSIFTMPFIVIMKLIELISLGIDLFCALFRVT